MKTVTVHMVGNAHLDPVWLWPWQSGADEAIATCRSACAELRYGCGLALSEGRINRGRG
jgi:alpha-mannosidase